MRIAVDVTNDLVKTISWAYYAPSGSPLPGTPAVLTATRVQTEDASGGFLDDSGWLPAASTSYVVSSSLNWLKVNNIRMLYKDDLNNFYIVNYAKVTVSTPIQLQALGFARTSGFVFQLTGQTGHSYLVQSSTDLVHWTNLLTPNLQASPTQFTDPSTNLNARFYRANLAN
jgi:hypothetical protein